MNGKTKNGREAHEQKLARLWPGETKRMAQGPTRTAKPNVLTPSEEARMDFLDALAKLGRILDAIEQCDLQNQFPVPVCLRAENAVMARMRFILDEVDSRLSKMGARNAELIAEWERMP